MRRRERTRHLIELGGLAVKSGLIDATEDDRAVLFGIFTEAAAALRGDKRQRALVLWRRRGQREFNAAKQETPAVEP